MRKKDVECEIIHQFKSEFKNIHFSGMEKCPENVYNVDANIMDDDYYGAGTYQVKIDFYGDEPNDDGNGSMSGHFEITCEVEITANTENSPVVKIKTPIILHKQPY